MLYILADELVISKLQLIVNLTSVLQAYYKHITSVLQGFYKDVTRVLNQIVKLYSWLASFPGLPTVQFLIEYAKTEGEGLVSFIT